MGSPDGDCPGSVSVLLLSIKQSIPCQKYISAFQKRNILSSEEDDRFEYSQSETTTPKILNIVLRSRFHQMVLVRRNKAKKQTRQYHDVPISSDNP